MPDILSDNGHSCLPLDSLNVLCRISSCTTFTFFASASRFQEQPGVRPPGIPCHHRRGQEGFALSEKANLLRARGSRGRSVYLQTGKVRLTVVSKRGKEATIGILSDGSFFGEVR